MPAIPLDDPGDFIPRGTWEGFGQRLAARNLITDPAKIKHYFETIGYETRPYGEGWNFAFRKRDTNDPWQPLNPKGLDLGDFTDLISDAVTGVVSGGAAVLGATAGALAGAPSGPGAVATAIGGGAAAGGLAAAGMETLRQGIGKAMGINEEFDPAQIGLVGAGAALAEPIGAAGGAVLRGAAKGTSAIMRKVGELAPEVAAKFVGIKALGTETAGQVMAEGARLTQGGKVPLVTPERAGMLMRGAMRFIRRVGIKEVTDAANMVEAADNGGVTTNLGRAMRALQNQALVESSGEKQVVSKETTSRTMSVVQNARAGLTQDAMTGDIGAFAKKSGTMGERFAQTTRETLKDVPRPAASAAERVARMASPELPTQAGQLLETLRRESGFYGPWEETPIRVAYEIKQALQKIASGAGAYEGAGPSEIFSNLVKSTAGKVRGRVADTMEMQTPGFKSLMLEAEKKMRALEWTEAALGLAGRGPQEKQAAANFVRGVYGANKAAYLEALNDLDIRFMTGKRGQLINRAVRAVHEANVGMKIGARGRGEVFGTRGILGQIAGPVAVGAALLGHPGASAVAVGVTSPRVMMKAYNPIASGYGALQALADRVATRGSMGSLTRVAGKGFLNTAQIAALRSVMAQEGGGSKRMARMDDPANHPPEKRKLVFIGQ